MDEERPRGGAAAVKPKAREMPQPQVRVSQAECQLIANRVRMNRIALPLAGPDEVLVASEPRRDGPCGLHQRRACGACSARPSIRTCWWAAESSKRCSIGMVGRLQLDPEVQQSLEKSFNKGFHNTRKAITDESAILGHKEGDQYGNEAPCRLNVKRIAACQHNAPPGRTAPRSPRRYSAVVQASARVAARADSTWSAGQS